MKRDPQQNVKKACRYCDSPIGKPFLDLGLSPLANNLPRADEQGVEEFKCPLALVKCSKCHLVQLTHVVPPELMFSHYLYVSSTTKTFQDHFAGYARDLKSRLTKTERPVAVDIGSNDGLLVSCYQKEGMNAVGVEPAKNLSDQANQNGFRTINSYFNRESVQAILKEYGPAHVISANNVFAHIDDVQAVLLNVNELLATDGIFVIEFPYLFTMFEKMFFDMIYHEHLSYIAITPLDYFVRRFGFEIFDIENVASHGGSLRVFIKKQAGPYKISDRVHQFLRNEEAWGCRRDAPYHAFAGRVAEVKREIVGLINRLKAEGKRIAGYGAPAKATTIVNYCSLNSSQIDYVIDDNPLKQNRLVPGAKIPIVASTYLKTKPTDYLLIFAWNFADEIIQRLKNSSDREVAGYIIPLPKPILHKN